MDNERTMIGVDDCNRLQSKAVDCGREGSKDQLTNKERRLRGLRYFVWVFVVFFVLNMLTLDCAPTATAGGVIAFGLLCASFPALLAGVIVAAFARRRLWHGFLAVGVALLVASLMGIA